MPLPLLIYITWRQWYSIRFSGWVNVSSDDGSMFLAISPFTGSMFVVFHSIYIGTVIPMFVELGLFIDNYLEVDRNTIPLLFVRA